MTSVETERIPKNERAFTFTDPKQYWEAFVNSGQFENAVRERSNIIAKNRKSQVTGQITDEARQYLLSRPDLTKDALYSFYRDGHGLKFDFSFDGWSPTFRTYLNDYWRAASTMERRAARENLSRDEIYDMDVERMNKHTRASMQMTKEGLAPSDSIGRMMIEMMTEDKGLGHVDPREERRREMVQAEISRGLDR